MPVKQNTSSILLYTGTALVVAVLAYGAVKIPAMALSLGICVAVGLVVFAWRFVPPARDAGASGAEVKTSPTSLKVAAAAILFGFLLLFFAMPSIMIWLADFSPWLAAGFGTLAVLSFFLIFWLRARQQRGN